MNVYDFNVRKIDGEVISLEKYKGKVLLIVNTASKCGYTPQFAALEELYQKYKDQGFEILGFPSNQFGRQDPGTNEEILEFCTVNYGVTFQMFSKINVNGKDADPLYKFLQNEENGFKSGKIKWNFNKFLVDKNGKVVNRYSSGKTPGKIGVDVEKYLKG